MREAKNHILIVDDNRMNLKIARRMLEDRYAVTTMESAAAALGFLRSGENSTDLILLDIQMPEMDGFQMMETLQGNEALKPIPVIFLTADLSAETEKKCLTMGAVDYITKPFVPEVLRARVARTMEIENYRKHLERMVAEQLQRITQIQRDVNYMVVRLIESRDGTTGEHVMRTAEFAALLASRALELGLYPDTLTPAYVEMIGRAAPLHDIGKIVIPDAILQKPGKLTEEEYEKIKDHAAAGGRIIRENMSSVEERSFVEIASQMARYHHEKWNGGGYPDGLSGERIPLCARILTVADVFDALTFKRQYKDDLPMETVLGIMREGRGVSFEPKLLDVFLSMEDEVRQLVTALRDGSGRSNR